MAFLLAALPLPSALGQQAQFFPLGFTIGFEGVSSDGQIVVGSTPWPAIEAVRWTTSGGPVGLGLLPNGTFSLAGSASSDGEVVIGHADSGGQSNWQVTIWTQSNGLVSLGTLPGSTKAVATSVSHDGAVVVGFSYFSGYLEAFRWTAATGMTPLGGFPGEPIYSDARATNADGSVIVGLGKIAGQVHPFRWTAQSGMVPLQLLPGYTGAGAADVSADGNTVVGQAGGAFAEGYKWTVAGGMVALGDLPGGPVASSANGVSDAGLVIVGSGRTASDDEAVFWTPTQGPISIESHLSSLGVTAHLGWRLRFAEAVSADGLRIIGMGINPAGQSEGWLAILPDPWTSYCTAKVNSLGCTPTIDATGVPSASNAWSFFVAVTNALNQKAGLFLYKVGGSPASVPFRGGTLCVGPTAIRRTPAVFSGGNSAPPLDCSGSFVLDFNAFAAGLGGGNPDPALLSVGSTYRCQAWGRDPGFPPPQNTSLSNALEVPIGP